MSTVKRVFGVVVMGLLLAAFGAQSAFGHEGDGHYGADCSGPNAQFGFVQASVCGVVTNRIKGFDAHGGHLLGNQTLQITHINETHSTYGGGAAYKDGAVSMEDRITIKTGESKVIVERGRISRVGSSTPAA